MPGPAHSDLRVGMIGIGAFGSKAALRLLWSKYPTLQVYDIVDMYTRQFTSNNGGMAVSSPKMLADVGHLVLRPTGANWGHRTRISPRNSSSRTVMFSGPA